MLMNQEDKIQLFMTGIDFIKGRVMKKKYTKKSCLKLAVKEHLRGILKI